MQNIHMCRDWHIQTNEIGGSGKRKHYTPPKYAVDWEETILEQFGCCAVNCILPSFRIKELTGWTAEQMSLL
jgi:hypothetical protein